jgi:hypothetical protein
MLLGSGLRGGGLRAGQRRDLSQAELTVGPALAGDVHRVEVHRPLRHRHGLTVVLDDLGVPDQRPPSMLSADDADVLEQLDHSPLGLEAVGERQRLLALQNILEELVPGAAEANRNRLGFVLGQNVLLVVQGRSTAGCYRNGSLVELAIYYHKHAK